MFSQDIWPVMFTFDSNFYGHALPIFLAFVYVFNKMGLLNISFSTTSSFLSCFFFFVMKLITYFNQRQSSATMSGELNQIISYNHAIQSQDFYVVFTRRTLWYCLATTIQHILSTLTSFHLPAHQSICYWTPIELGRMGLDVLCRGAITNYCLDND